VLASWRKQAGADDPQTLYAMRNVAGALEGQGKWAEAETIHREAFASWWKRAGNDDPQTLWECDGLYLDLTSQHKYDDAEQFLAGVLTPVFVNEPACSNILAHRLDLMGRESRWKEAAADATLVLKYQPADHYRYHILAGLLAITGNRADFEQLCLRIPPMFTNTSNPYIAERVAEDCLLLPNSGADLKQVDKLADMAVTCAADEPYFQACKALSEYRRGQFPEAGHWAEKSLKTSQVFAHAKGCAVLAMAQWQLGQKDVARATLAEGNNLAPGISHTNGTVDLGDSWVAWLFARITLDEAGQLIQPETVVEAKGKQ
jgi:tetratricopeptide (TPR) repeat protein